MSAIGGEKGPPGLSLPDGDDKDGGGLVLAEFAHTTADEVERGTEVGAAADLQERWGKNVEERARLRLGNKGNGDGESRICVQKNGPGGWRETKRR